MPVKANWSQHIFLTIWLILSSIGPISGQTNLIPLPTAHEKRHFAQILPVLSLLLLVPLGACQPNAVEKPASPPAAVQASCGENSSLETSLYGVIETAVAWSGSEMICENMQRPDGQGIRLRFAGDVSGERLALIIALPDLRVGQEGLETPANVTASVEGSGRFFTTPGLESCWVDIRSHAALPDNEADYELSGELSCIAPLGEVNGDANLTIPSPTFRTIVEWGG
jgi:hypothetical protein